MIQDCASSNKIKENKYKILRMSLLLGSDENREETINNFEDAAREIDTMNDEIYLKDIESKFYDTLKLEDEEKKLAVLVDYIGGRVEQRISLLSDFANVTGFDLQNLPPIKYYDKLDDYKERLKYIREYLDNTKQIDTLNNEIETAEKKLKEAYINKATSEEYNIRNEEILLNKFLKLISPLEELKNITEDNIDNKLNDAIAQVEESKKSLDIFTKSFTTLRGSGISPDEEEEYRSYVYNAREVYYANKEQEYLLKIYKLLLKKETEYSQILVKRDLINDIIYERIGLRKELELNESDLLSSLYDSLERQYEDIKNQRENIENIETLTDVMARKKEQVNDLEIDNQKVEILALLREFCMIDTYTEETSSNEMVPEVAEEPVVETTSIISTSPEIITQPENISESVITEEKSPLPEKDIFSSPTPIPEAPKSEEKKITPEEEVRDNQVVAIENPSTLDLDLVHSKANKVMQRVGEMLGIKPVEEKVISVTNDPPIESKTTPIEDQKKENFPEPLAVNPLFSNTIPENESTTAKNSIPEENSFWFPSDTPDALKDLPDLPVSNDNFFANNNIPDLNFPDLKINFGDNKTEETQ